MPFGNGWDYGIGFAVLEAHNGDHVYIRMLHNGEDVEPQRCKRKNVILRMGTVPVYAFNNYKI